MLTTETGAGAGLPNAESYGRRRTCPRRCARPDGLAQLDGGAQEIALRNATIGMWKIGATVLAVLLLAPGTGLGGG